jgi:hypothetical protein
MKRTWITVKRGILEPKHRFALGELIWLFMYILDITNWEEGVIEEWLDRGAAEEMEMPLSTLRDQRRKLQEKGYITCENKQHGIRVIVHNWTNPKEYTGKKYNVKNVSDTSDDIPNNTPSYTASFDDRREVEHSSFSQKSKVTNHNISDKSEPETESCNEDGIPESWKPQKKKKKDVDMMDGILKYSGSDKTPLEKKIALYPVDVQKTLSDLVDIYGWPASAIPEKSKGGNYALWIKDIHHINEMIQGHGRRALEATFEPCTKLSPPGRPGSIIWCIPGIVGKITKKQETKVVETAFSEHMKNFVPRRREV